MDSVIEKLEGFGIVPVAVVNDTDEALWLGECLCASGLRCVEVTLRTGAAVESIAALKKHYPELLVGAGTVMNVEQATEVCRAGAEFLVSPSVNPKLIAYAKERNVAVFPGVLTPTEIGLAVEMGLTHLKLFPADIVGGTDYIDTVAAPFGNVRFMPTGGINDGNFRHYLLHPNVFACGGSWLIGRKVMEKRNGNELTEHLRMAYSAAKEITGAVG